jgi:oxidase EvaA
MNIIKSYLHSLNSRSFSFHSLGELEAWIRKSNRSINISLKQVPLNELDKWNCTSSKVFHDSGKFFSIEGLKITGSIAGKNLCWEQPIINQPEYGYLGIIVREFQGVLHFLLQAKIEPGNVNKVQLSPTIQATHSNFSRVHQGGLPAYFEYFVNPDSNQIIYDQLQSEQGSRFLKKRNRNVVLFSSNAEPLDNRFRWFTLYQIQKFMQQDNLVNMDTRTVLGSLPYCYSPKHLEKFQTTSITKLVDINPLFSPESLNSSEYILNWLTYKKLLCDIVISKVPVEEIKNWKISNGKLAHKEGKFFEVIGVEVAIENREVINWSQPMIRPVDKGLIGLGFCFINKVPHFLIRAKFEIGLSDRIELGPSIQTSFGNLNDEDEKVLRYFDQGKKVYSVVQSEEGGRFYHEQNLNEVYEISYFNIADFESNFQWMTFAQIHHMMRFSGHVNIELRTMLANLALLFGTKIS